MTPIVAALLVAFVTPPLRPLHLRRCSPTMSERMASTHRKHALEKQAAEKQAAERSERAAQEAVQATIRVHREAIEGFEASMDHAAVLRELHQLDKSGIDPDVLCLESAARTLGGAKRWKQAAESAMTLRQLGLESSEPRALAAWCEALAVRHMLPQCLDVIAQADSASLELPPAVLDRALQEAARVEDWPAVLDLYGRTAPYATDLYAPSATRLEPLLSAIRAHGQLGQCRQALRLAISASRLLTPAPPDELWAMVTQECADCANTSMAGRRAAHAVDRLLAIRPAPEVASAALRALAAAELWNEAAAVAADASTPVDTDPQAWNTAVAAARMVRDPSLFLALAQARRGGGGSRDSHASVLSTLFELSWDDSPPLVELAWDHLEHARPLDKPDLELAWLSGLAAASRQMKPEVVVDVFFEMSNRSSSLRDVSAPVLERALRLGVAAAVATGNPAEGVRMLTAAAPRVKYSLWGPALFECVKLDQAQVALTALKGPAAEFAGTEAGTSLVFTAVSSRLSQVLLASGELETAVELSVFMSHRYCEGTQGVTIGEQAAEMVKKEGVGVDLRNHRSASASLGFQVSAVRDTTPPKPKRLELCVDMYSLMGIAPTPQLRQSTQEAVHTARSAFKAFKQLKRAARDGSEAARKKAVEAEEKSIKPSVSIQLDPAKGAARRSQQEIIGLLKFCTDRWGSLPMPAAAFEYLLFGNGKAPKDMLFKMLSDFQRLVDVRMSPATRLPTYITLLALSERSAQSQMAAGNWSQADASFFMSVSEHLITFLARCKTGTAEERGLAYALLGGLLHTRRRASLYERHGPGQPYVEAVMNWQLSGRREDGELLTVLSMAAADDRTPLTSQLLSRLIPLGLFMTDDAATLNAGIEAFVEGGGRPSGGQLVLASLASMGCSYGIGAQGCRVTSSHDTTTLRGAWNDLKSVWQLANRPDVAYALWPDLHASGMPLKQILEPLQDILLLGAMVQLNLVSGTYNAQGQVHSDAWGVEELKMEIHSVLETTSIPVAKIDWLLSGDRDDLIARSSQTLTYAHCLWLREGGWSLQRRMFAPLLTRYMQSVDGQVPGLSGAGGRRGEFGQWEFEGRLVPRLATALMDPSHEDAPWARDIVSKVGMDDTMGLLSRALACAEGGTELTMSPSEIKLAATADELLGLDLRVLETWDDEQRAELRRTEVYLRTLNQGDAAFTTTVQGLARSGQTRVVAPQPKSRGGFGAGFGGSAGGGKPKRGREGAKRKKKK